MGGDKNKKNHQRSLSNIGQQMYHFLLGIYGDEFDSFDHEIQESIYALLSEMMHLLEVSQEGLKVNNFASH
jgi:hypothetical protein